MPGDASSDAPGGIAPGRPLTAADLEAAARRLAEDAPTPAPAEGGNRGAPTVEEPTRAQQALARRVAEAKAIVPEFTLRVEVDMEQALALRRGLGEIVGDGPPVPTLNDLVVKASALALRDFPRVNGAYRDGRFELYPRVNVGFAVAGEGTLVVPVVFDADRKGLGAIARETRALAAKARDATLRSPELAGATFTVSNLGRHGVADFTAVITPPQAAVLAVAAVVAQAVVRDGEVVAGHRMALTLACDHRIVYGVEAARFLGRVRALLEAPLALTA